MAGNWQVFSVIVPGNIAVQEIAPPGNFREARCLGGTITGPWYLEVKNWPYYGVAKGIEGPLASLRGQINSHLDKTKDIANFLADPNRSLDTIPGICYRFLRAGPEDGFFPRYLEAIPAHFKEQLLKDVFKLKPEAANDPALKAALEKRVADFCNDRVIVQLAAEVQ